MPNQPLSVHVDDATFQKNLALYIKHTSKTVEDAINFKLYDASREAVKTTPKANKNDIIQKLNAISTKYPKRTVAEMIVIDDNHLDGNVAYDLQMEVQKLIHYRTSHIAFVKGGWLPGIKQLLAKIGKSFVNISGVNHASFGGANPARTTGTTIKGEVYNDVYGYGNKSFVEAIKEHGAEAGTDKVNSDIVTYLEKELQVPIYHFNQS